MFSNKDFWLHVDSTDLTDHAESQLMIRTEHADWHICPSALQVLVCHECDRDHLWSH